MDLELKPWGTYAVREPFFKGRYLIGPVIITRTQQIVPKWEPVETLTNGHIRCELVSIEIL